MKPEEYVDDFIKDIEKDPSILRTAVLESGIVNIICKAIADEREKWFDYVILLSTELETLIPLADMRGWKSKLYDEGVKMRKDLGITEEEVTEAIRKRNEN